MDKIIKIFVSLFVFLVLISENTTAQNNNSKKKVKKVYCKCTIQGLPRAKGLSISYEYRPSYQIKTTDNTFISKPITNNTIKNNARLELKLKIPIINKPYLSIVGGFKYNKEQYKFKDVNTGNPLYKSLEDRDLRSIGGSITVLKPTHSNKFWVLKLSANLNGDYDNSTISKTNYLKFSISPALAWRKSDDLIYAVGLSYAYNFGRPALFPTFAINYNLNDRWSLESVLPVFIKTRYSINENFFWYNNLEVDGASYRLNNTEPVLAKYQSLHLHRSEIKLTSSIEKQITGWLWGGLELGGTHNISYNLTNSATRRSDIIYKNKVGDGLICRFSIFLVPPKKFYQRVIE